MLWCVALLLLALSFGCASSQRSSPAAGLSPDEGELGATIGSLADVFASNAIPVMGYGIVGGLNGTGSSECPPQIRAYLEKYILQHFSGSSVNIGEIISSQDTAIVVVEGVIPPAAAKNQRFDVGVVALPGTGTTSLKDGWLYEADLYEARWFGAGLKSFAIAHGPIFVDSIGSERTDNRTGYVLGGGTILEDYKLNLAIRRPDYRTASQIRNRINERFGYETAWALAPGSIELSIPTKYATRKARFIQLVRATYLADSPELTSKRVLAHIQKLAIAPNKGASEIALEALGNAALPNLAGLLNSSDPEVRLRAARCMLNLGDKRGKEALRNIATDTSSVHRVDAIEAIVDSAAGEDVAALFRGLLREDDFAVRAAAYEGLIHLKDVTVSTKMIASSFYLDQIPGSGKSVVFVARQNQPRVALFGAPIYCRNDLFIQTPDGDITINANKGERFATIIRKHPRRPDTIVQLKSSLDLADIIQTLCREPVSPPGGDGPGLGVSYSTLVALLKQMVDFDAIPAEFRAGPQPKPLPIIKK